MAERNDRDHRNAPRAEGHDGAPRRPRSRRRALLNLGIPFVQVDDFLNQSDDAVRLGYSVLVDTVDQIKAGYHEAEEFTKKVKEWRERGDPNELPPAIELEKVANRAEQFQEIAFNAIREGTDIFLDSLRSGTKAMSSVAKTFEQSRKDVDANPPLAGPVFPDTIVIKAVAGEPPPVKQEMMHHKGLKRLRINAVVSPKLQLLVSAQQRSTLDVRSVEFEPLRPKDDKSDELQLTIDIGRISADTTPGAYEGIIRASNFELAIAKLRVEVTNDDSHAARRSSWSTSDVSMREDSTPRVRRVGRTTRKTNRKR